MPETTSSYPATSVTKGPIMFESLRSRVPAPSKSSSASLLVALTCALLSCPGSANAQTLTPRIKSEISNLARTSIVGSHNPRATAANDAGPIAADAPLQGISIVFRRTDAQELALQSLIAAQQDPASPLYHLWLTPDQFASQFGVASSDLAKVSAWLEQQGFAVEGPSRSGNRITFSGTAAKVETAFGSEIHYFKQNGETNFAPASDLTVPAALGSIIADISNLSSFRPKPHVKLKEAQLAPNYTSSQSSSHFLTPKDIATIYDINAAYSAGYTGTGQSIVAVGQSAVVLSDIEKFQTAAGLTVKDPTVVLVPNSGTSAISTGDEAESDLDLEYTGGIAKGATIYFVYTGNSPNYGVFDALQYAITNKLAPIISVSYGTCETNLSTTQYASLNSMLAQAATQGQTVIAASGDDGSTDCAGSTSLTTAQQRALAIDFPSDSQYVTGMGGSEFTAAAVATTNTTYWTAASGSDVISSALSYMPEQAWNDDAAPTSTSTGGISSGGGGVSALTARPSWQTGVTGIPSGSFRVTPDISLASSPNNAGYLYCSSDSTLKITGSCANGFRDSNSAYLTVAGGTSFAAPIFSGMLAILNQKLNSTGQGLINPTLYALASNATTYASAFHDITTGSNACTAGSTFCTTAGASAYSATTGYDQATGLGSIDLYNLLTAWPTSTAASTLSASTTTLSAATTTPASGASDLITITVAPSSTTLTTVPTGTVSIAVDGTTVNASASLASGTATYTFSSTTAGSHVVTATYSGDSIYATSIGTVTLTIGGTTTTGTKSLLLAATSLSITSGASGTSTVTITPVNGYTGTVTFSVVTSSTLPYACYTLPNTAVTGTAAITATLTVYTSSSLCSGTSAVKATGNRSFATASNVSTNQSTPTARLLLAGLMLCGLLGCKSSRLRKFTPALLLAAFGLALSGCGSGGGTSTATNNLTAKGTYTLTIVGTDTTTSSIAGTTNITLTVN